MFGVVEFVARRRSRSKEGGRRGGIHHYRMRCRQLRGTGGTELPSSAVLQVIPDVVRPVIVVPLTQGRFFEDLYEVAGNALLWAIRAMSLPACRAAKNRTSVLRRS